MLLETDPDDRALSKLDLEISRLESNRAGVVDALAIARSRVAQLNSALSAKRDQEAREVKAQKSESYIPTFEVNMAAIKQPLEKLTAALHECGIPEAKGAAHLLTESWTQVAREIESRIIGELQSQARALRAGPAPKPLETKTAPALQLQPYRAFDRPDTTWTDFNRV